MDKKHPVIGILIAARAEWDAVKRIWTHVDIERTPLGESMTLPTDFYPQATVVVCFGGWGKASAAAAAQHLIDRWSPELLINLGTCGGFAGHVKTGEIILAHRTVMYDVIERMSDADRAIRAYSTDIDLAWLNGQYSIPVREGVIASADQDLDPARIRELHEKYSAIAGDWESAAIAYACRKNRVPCLILRGVSDTIDDTGGEVYGNLALFKQRTQEIMQVLTESLPAWIEIFHKFKSP